MPFDSFLLVKKQDKTKQETPPQKNKNKTVMGRVGCRKQGCSIPHLALASDSVGRELPRVLDTEFGVLSALGLGSVL